MVAFRLVVGNQLKPRLFTVMPVKKFLNVRLLGSCSFRRWNESFIPLGPASSLRLGLRVCSLDLAPRHTQDTSLLFSKEQAAELRNLSDLLVEPRLQETSESLLLVEFSFQRCH